MEFVKSGGTGHPGDHLQIVHGIESPEPRTSKLKKHPALTITEAFQSATETTRQCKEIH